MYLKKEIYEAFKLMGLSSEHERKLFEKMKMTADESEQYYLFIIARNDSEKIKEIELENAKLE